MLFVTNISANPTQSSLRDIYIHRLETHAFKNKKHEQTNNDSNKQNNTAAAAAAAAAAATAAVSALISVLNAARRWAMPTMILAMTYLLIFVENTKHAQAPHIEPTTLRNVGLILALHEQINLGQ